MTQSRGEDTRARAALLAEVARCPRCREPLSASGDALSCVACQSTFANLGAVPTLVSDRQGLVRTCQEQLAAFEAMMERTALELQKQLGRFDLLPSTRQRLERIASANSSNRSAIAALFAAVGLTFDPIALERARKRAGDDTRVVQYFEQVLRDWGWPASDQNQASLARLRHVAGDGQPLGKTLVLGAGPARLAYDLHRALAPELTIALDLDPFVLLVAHEVLFAGGLTLVETPIDPAAPDMAALPRRLEREGDEPRRFACVLANAFEPPFADGSFDTIVTPWFIDVAAEDFRDVLALVARLLRPGGRWLNDGPLLYKTSSFDLRYSQYEVLELLRLAGFRVDQQTATEARYLRSPDSAHARTETVLSFCATKQQPVAEDAFEATPNWIVLRHLSVPAFVRGAASGPPVVAQILSLVDGSRCINDIAAIVQQAMQPPPGMTIVDIVSGLLLQAYRAQRVP